jgi:2-hydroxycyclohexanecarboxyl-CoA dehydrogenase
MISHGGGKIVNISPMRRVGSSWGSGLRGRQGGDRVFYTVAREVARYKINVNVVCPGLTETPLLQAVRSQSEQTARIRSGDQGHAVQASAQPEEIAAAVLFFSITRGGIHYRTDAKRERRADHGLELSS